MPELSVLENGTGEPESDLVLGDVGVDCCSTMHPTATATQVAASTHMNPTVSVRFLVICLSLCAGLNRRGVVNARVIR